MHFSDLVRDPVEAALEVRRWHGLPSEPEVAEAMGAYLLRRRSDRRGAHQYDASRYGLRPEAVREAFKSYTGHFDVYGPHTSSFRAG